jgi:hypothetical protein
MQPRYEKGTRVRVRVGDKAAYAGNHDMRRYDNATGTVVDCQTVVAFSAYATGLEMGPGGPDMRLHMYTVEVEGGILLAGLVEDYLEENRDR